MDWGIHQESQRVHPSKDPVEFVAYHEVFVRSLRVRAQYASVAYGVIVFSRYDRQSVRGVKPSMEKLKSGFYGVQYRVK